jgi:hypothetical protein
VAMRASATSASAASLEIRSLIGTDGINANLGSLGRELALDT